MNHSIVTDFLKIKKIDIEQKINSLSNINRNPHQERTLQALLLEQTILNYVFLNWIPANP